MTRLPILTFLLRARVMTANRPTLAFRVLRQANSVLAVAAMLGAVAVAGELWAAEPKSKDDVETLVRAHFASKPHYAPGDLISRADVEPILSRLNERGFRFGNQESQLADFLPHNSFLVNELATPAGRKFMRKVSKYPDVYDRLERLSWMPAGREMVRDLIKRPDGPEVLLSLTTPEGATAVEKVMGSDVRGKNFALPTGHIHTVEQLLARLKEMQSEGAASPSEEHAAFVRE